MNNEIKVLYCIRLYWFWSTIKKSRRKDLPLVPPLGVNIGLKAFEQIAVLCTRINKFYLHVKFFIIRLFTDFFRALSSKNIKCCLEKNYRVALASPYERRLLLYLFIYSMPSKGATHCPKTEN